MGNSAFFVGLGLALTLLHSVIGLSGSHFHHETESSLPQNNVTCTIPLNEGDKMSFVRTIEDALPRQEIVFVRFHLHFRNVSEIYEQPSSIIEPGTIIWALEGKGYHLLSLEHTFVIISLGTLSPGVSSPIDMAVNLRESECFMKGTNAEKERALANLVRVLVQDTREKLTNNKDFYEGKSSKVCLESRPINTELFNLRKTDTVYKCWIENGTAVFHLDYAVKTIWINIIKVLGLVLALFAPLLLRPLTHKDLPIVHNEKQYVAKMSNLPLGTKYWCLHSSSRKLFATRILLSIFLIFAIPLTGWSILLYVEGRPFLDRLNATFLFNFRSSFTCFTLINAGTWIITIASYMLIVTLLWYFSPDSFYNAEKNKGLMHRLKKPLLFVIDIISIKKEDLGSFEFYPSARLQNTQLIPELSGSKFNEFLQYLSYRGQMAVNPSIWNNMPKLCGIKIIDYFCFTVALICNSVPAVYLLVRPIVLEMHIKRTNTYERSFWLFLKIVLALTFLYFAFMACAIVNVNVLQISHATFCGLIINHDKVAVPFLSACTFILFIISLSTTFYDKYKSLLRMFIDEALEVEKGLIQRSAQNSSNDIIVRFHNIPHVPLDLFMDYINVYHPIHIRVLKRMSFLFVTCVVATLLYTNLEACLRLPDVPNVTHSLAIILLPRILPHIDKILKSKETQIAIDEEKKKNIKLFLQTKIAM